MVINATNSIGSGTINWYINNLYTSTLTSLNGTLPLNEGDILKLEIIGSQNTSDFQVIIPTVTSTSTYELLNKTLTISISGSDFPNSTVNNTIITECYLTITQNGTTINLDSSINFVYNQNFIFDISGEPLDFNQSFDISYYIVERYWSNGIGFVSVASPQIFTRNFEN